MIAVCESFGGIYRHEISGQTKILVVGAEPGVTKITNAQSTPGVLIVEFEVKYLIIALLHYYQTANLIFNLNLFYNNL